MTHLAWVPAEWEEAALETLAGLEERHPSRGILLFPRPDAEDGMDAKISVLAFPLQEQRRHIAAEVIALRLRGSACRAPASIVNPLLVPALPVFLRWRGRPRFGEQYVDQLVEVCDRLIVDSRIGPTCPMPTASCRSRGPPAPTSPGGAPSAGAAASRAVARNRRAAKAARRGPGRRCVSPRGLAPSSPSSARSARARRLRGALGGRRRRLPVPRAARAAELERPPLGRAGRVRARPGLRGRGHRGRYFLSF